MHLPFASFATNSTGCIIPGQAQEAKTADQITTSD